jgi:tetratricopeptide (TPR) repeat protein
MKVFCGVTVIFLVFGLRAAAQTPGGTQPRSALQNYQIGRDLESSSGLPAAEYYYNEAIRICQDEVFRNIATGETYTVITWALRRLNRHADVISRGEQGLRLYPDEYRIVETMGESWFHLDDYNRSLSYMQRFVNAVPQGERSPVAYFYIGEIYRLTKRYLHADIAYTAALRLNPGNALWWRRLAEVKEALGDRSSAIDAFQQVIRIEPNNREAAAGLVRLQAQ